MNYEVIETKRYNIEYLGFPKKIKEVEIRGKTIILWLTGDSYVKLREVKKWKKS